MSTISKLTLQARPQLLQASRSTLQQALNACALCWLQAETPQSHVESSRRPGACHRRALAAAPSAARPKSVSEQPSDCEWAMPVESIGSGTRVWTAARTNGRTPARSAAERTDSPQPAPPIVPQLAIAATVTTRPGASPACWTWAIRILQAAIRCRTWPAAI
jgi:hypothetical protein